MSTLRMAAASQPQSPQGNSSNRANFVSFYELDDSLAETADNCSTLSSSTMGSGQAGSGMFSKLMHRMRTTLHNATGSLDMVGLTGSSSSSNVSDNLRATLANHSNNNSHATS